MKPYFKNLYPFLILRKLKIKPDPMALFGRNVDDPYYNDFEYNEEVKDNFVDGYEINIFETKDPFDYTQFQIDKKYLDINFIGNRNSGDIGLLLEKQTENGTSYKCFFSNEIHEKFYPIIYKFYKILRNKNNTSQYFTDHLLIDNILLILTENNRDKKITEII